MELTNEQNEMLKGEVNPMRIYAITLGLSSGSKGVMFVLYSEQSKCLSQYVNPFNYLGQLADNFDDAVIKARQRVGKFQIEVWDDETRIKRRKPVTIPWGKYIGKTIEEIFDIDPKYIFWLSNQDIKSKKLYEAICNYSEIAKELVVTENREKSNTILPIDEKLVNRTLTIYKKENNGTYSYNGPETFKTKLKDVDGNLFVYAGKDLGNVGDVIELTCKVKKTFESLGYSFNVLGLR